MADTYVDKEFGTGAVKLTPAHDFNDYQLGKRHDLKFINILNDDGTLNENAGQFKGQRRFDARYTVVEELTKLGLFTKKESNPMKIPLCEKSKDVIEPYMKPQWWVQMREMADAGLKAVDEGKITITPESARKSYRHWMSNIQDWCISRQLWWGHRIPAYRVVFEGDSEVETKDSAWIVGRTEEEARSKAAAKFGSSKPFRLEQDPDCLDTWFSSGLWPFATLGWPDENSGDLKRFFPTSTLESGWDILTFWMARMIVSTIQQLNVHFSDAVTNGSQMLSLKLTGEVPFREIYCHSLVRDSEGRKMSKSLGNVVDPLDIINGIELETLHQKLHVGNLKEEEIARATKYQKTAFPQGIPECGADAMRFTLLGTYFHSRLHYPLPPQRANYDDCTAYTTGGGDINFDIQVMAAYRRFCNKIYQASKYVLGKLPPGFAPAPLNTIALSVPERWILHRMNQAIQGVNDALEAREFSRATKLGYQFFYDQLCDVFIENSKSLLSDGTPEEQKSVQQTLYHILHVSMRLLHPFLPFLTEEIYQRLPRKADDAASVMVAKYPTADPALDFAAEAEDYEVGLRCAGGIRSLASDYNIRANGQAYIKTSTPESFAKVSSQLADIKTLSGKGIVDVKVLGTETDEASLPSGCAVYVVSAEIVVLLQVETQIKDVGAEIKKLTTKLQKTTVAITKQEEFLNREGFEKVSETVQASEKQKLVDLQSAKENYERTLEEFGKLKLESKA